MKPFLLLVFCMFTTLAAAQTDWRQAVQQWLLADDMEEGIGEETMERLQQWAEHPVNLNQTTREELEQLPFLTDTQIEGLTAYINRYRPIRSLSELQMVKTLDAETRRLLQWFVFAGEGEAKSPWPKLTDVAEQGKHVITGTGKIPFYERKGDSNGYLGYRYRHDIRYQFNYHNRITFGLTAAQDAGEPFFKGGNRWGYDHYSYYLQLRDMGRLQELNVGMYRVQMGMGLVINSGLYLGKLATLQSMGRPTHTITAHSSRSTAGYLQGAAATVRLSKQWQVTAFASMRYVDATLNDDGTARTLLTNGYHRTQTEMAKKHNTRETDLGGSIGWRQGTLYAFANAAYTHFNRRLQPQTTTLYRRYAATGNHFFNASLNYGYNNFRWSFSGETALNRRGAIAAIHTVSLRATEQLSLLLLHRYYDKQYTAIHAQSFREGSSVQNEHGIYLGATWKPSPAWQMQGYVDYAHFPWARYTASASSDAFDGMLAARYSWKRWRFNGRYRMHIRQQDDSQKKRLINRTEHRMRLGVDCGMGNRWSLQTQADGIVSLLDGKRSRGIMVSEQATGQWKVLKIQALAGWFCTDDYDSRIYHYEPSVLYDFSFPMYYGRGIRYATMLHANIGRHLAATAKIGITKYFDRDVISSGLQQIGHSSMADLLLQLRIIM